MKITRKEFERQYSAELLPVSTESYTIGDIFNWEYKVLLFSPQLEYKANNVALIFNDKILYDKLVNIPFVDALIPDVDITRDVGIDVSIKVPSLNNFDVSAQIKNESIIQFSFGKIKSKSIIHYRPEIGLGLDHLKKNDFTKYRRSIGRNEIAIGFFYSGDVVLVVDKTISDTAALKVELGTQGIVFSANNDNHSKETIIIKVPTCPFAVQLLNGREL
jgi:hypothetical protein